MGVINRKERFATEGLRFQRLNGDGTIPTPQRFLGFANTVDLSGVLVAGKADLTVRVDGGAIQTRSCDFSAVPDLTAVPVASAVTVLTTAAFSTFTWSLDPDTTRLKGSTSGGGNKIQVVGPLAAALDFGQCVKYGGNGNPIISFFDDETISIGLPKDIKDKEEIDIEGAKGTITRMVIGAMLQGLSPVVTFKQKDYDALELIQGGKLDRAAGTYDPPLSNESEHPTFYAEIFSAIYSVGSNKLTDVAGYEKLLLRSMIGTEGDVPIEAKAWAQYAYNLVATEYTDETGKAWPSYQEQTLTPEEFDALQVKSLKIA
jgi:hypothetical protein